MARQSAADPQLFEETSRRCSKCGTEKPIENFTVSYNRKYRRRSCKQCDRPEFRAKHTEWRNKNRAHVRERAKFYQKRRLANMTPEQKAAHDEKMAKLAIARRDAKKAQAYAKFGGAICACCGETEEKFLSIDHVNNDGYQLRKGGQPSGREVFYTWLVRHGKPSDYQVLCMNCNHGKSRNGGICPHEERRVQRLSGNGVGPSGPKPPALICDEVKI